MDSFRYHDYIDQIVVFAMEPSSRMALISRKFSIGADVGIRFTDRSSELTFLYHEKVPNNRDLSIYLAQFDSASVNGSTIIRREIDPELEFNALMKELHSVESSILKSIKLEDGIYSISFEYAAKDTNFISSIILHFVNRIKTLKLIYMGPLDDYLKCTLTGQNHMDITSVSFSILNPRDDAYQSINPGGRKFAILKMPMGDNRVRFLMNEIDREDLHKFQSYTWGQMESASNISGFYKPMMDKLYSSQVILMYNAQIIEKKWTTFYFEFSTRQSKDFLRCMSEAIGVSGLKKYRINYLKTE